MRQRCAVLVANLLIKVEAEVCPGSKLDPSRCKGAQAQLWSLQIGKYPDRPACCCLHSPDCAEPGAVILMRPMAEIEPEHIDTGFEQRSDLLRC